MRVPEAPMPALAGAMSTLLLDGQNALPLAALEAGYDFRFPALIGALENLTSRGTPPRATRVREARTETSLIQ